MIGTAKPELLNEDGDDVRMRVDVSFLCTPGLSDAQLDEALMTGIAHAAGAIETYISKNMFRIISKTGDPHEHHASSNDASTMPTFH